jgi:hypothetical protein
VFITFLSDFGLSDDFVGTCHGVMKRIAPEAQIIDITHGIPAQAVLQGALVLAPAEHAEEFGQRRYLRAAFGRARLCLSRPRTPEYKRHIAVISRE